MSPARLSPTYPTEQGGASSRDPIQSTCFPAGAWPACRPSRREGCPRWRRRKPCCPLPRVGRRSLFPSLFARPFRGADPAEIETGVAGDDGARFRSKFAPHTRGWRERDGGREPACLPPDIDGTSPESRPSRAQQDRYRGVVPNDGSYGPLPFSANWARSRRPAAFEGTS